MPHSLILLNDSLPGASLLNFRDKRHLRVCFGVTGGAQCVSAGLEIFGCSGQSGD